MTSVSQGSDEQRPSQRPPSLSPIPHPSPSLWQKRKGWSMDMTFCKKITYSFADKSTSRGLKILKLFPLDLLCGRAKLVCLQVLERKWQSLKAETFMSASSLVDMYGLLATLYRIEIKCHRSVDKQYGQAVLYCWFKFFYSSWPFHVLQKISLPVGCPWRHIRNILTLLNFDQKRVFSNHCSVGDRSETSQWLSRLQHTPAQLCVEKPAHPGKPQRTFQEEAGRRFGGCTTLCAEMAAELGLPPLTTAQLSCAATTLQVPVPGHVPHWPRPRVSSQPDTGTASSLGSHRVTLHSGWPSYCLWACLEQESLTCVLDSPQPCLISGNLSDPFPEPGLNSILSEPCSCLQTHLLGCWGMRPWLVTPHAARLVSMLCPDSPALRPAIPCWGWRSCWNREYRPDTHKIKVWHRVRALLSSKKESKSILLSGKKYYFVLEHCSLCEGCWHSSKVKPLEQSFQKQNLYSLSLTLGKREPQLPATVCGVGWSHTTGTDCQCAD